GSRFEVRARMKKLLPRTSNLNPSRNCCGTVAVRQPVPVAFSAHFEGAPKSMLKIRLRRQGATHAPFYRIVVSDSLKTPSASTVEQIGHYDPKRNPADVKIDKARVDYWVSKGAQLSPTVKSILKKTK